MKRYDRGRAIMRGSCDHLILRRNVVLNTDVSRHRGKYSQVLLCKLIMDNVYEYSYYRAIDTSVRHKKRFFKAAWRVARWYFSKYMLLKTGYFSRARCELLSRRILPQKRLRCIEGYLAPLVSAREKRLSSSAVLDSAGPIVSETSNKHVQQARKRATRCLSKRIFGEF